MHESKLIPNPKKPPVTLAVAVPLSRPLVLNKEISQSAKKEQMIEIIKGIRLEAMLGLLDVIIEPIIAPGTHA